MSSVVRETMLLIPEPVGLSALTILSQDDWGLLMDFEGVIFPGELPEAPESPVEAALAVD